VVTNDGHQVVQGDLVLAVFVEVGLHVQGVQGEGDVGGDLSGVEFVAESLQVDAQNLKNRTLYKLKLGKHLSMDLHVCTRWCV
jgi:hypothetical protein